MPKVIAAVLERSRRSTAGKRMSSLVGEAQEDDDTFWSHSIWSESGGGFTGKGSRKRRRAEEGGGSSSSSGSEGGGEGDDGEGDDGEGSSMSDGEGSYRMSDEDPDAVVDKFDSDFNESESEDEDGDGEVEEEQELRAEERREAASRRKKNQRLGVPLKSSAGRELMKKKTGKMTKRGPLGEGWNAGLVLNWPPPSGGMAPAVAKAGAAGSMHTHALDSRLVQGSASVPAVSQSKPQHSPSTPAIDLTQPAARRFPQSPKRSNLRTPTSSTAAPSTKAAPKPKRPRAGSTPMDRKKATKKRRYTQEELILESIMSTETENGKWLSSRKRGKDDVARSEKASAAGNSRKSSLNHKVSRFHSRRGCSNTLTFFDMDHLPEILARRGASSPGCGDLGDAPHCGGSASKRRRADGLASETGESARRAECVITGRIARYRDPQTMSGYHDVDAYREIRRRLEAGELTVSQPAHNFDGRKLNSRSNNRTSAGSGFPSDTPIVGRRSKTHFPFAPDQPTMVAEVRSDRPILKVMVTQGGFPVSPPPRARIRLKLPVKQQPSLAEGSRYYSNRKEPPLLPPSVAMQNNGHGRIAVGNFAKKKKDAPPPLVVSSSLQPTAELQSRHYQTAQPIEQTQIKMEAEDFDYGNRTKDGVQPQTVSSSPSDTVAAGTMLRTRGKVETANKEFNKKTNSSPPIKKQDVSRSSTTADNKDDIVPERTKSNGKITTIEAT